jgi:hypothetical protein
MVSTPSLQKYNAEKAYGKQISLSPLIDGKETERPPENADAEEGEKQAGDVEREAGDTDGD